MEKTTTGKYKFEITIDGSEKDHCTRDRKTIYWFTITGHNYIADGKYGICISNNDIAYLHETGEETDCKLYGHFQAIEIDISHWD